MSKSTLLPLLADGEFRSGQELADVLGVSRTAVWKQVNRLATDSGIVIETVKGRGYRIPGGLDLLDADKVSAALHARPRALLSRLDILDSVDSTNVYSTQSPLGSAILGKKTGDAVSYVAPNGRSINVTVVKVEAFRG